MGEMGKVKIELIRRLYDEWSRDRAATGKIQNSREVAWDAFVSGIERWQQAMAELQEITGENIERR